MMGSGISHKSFPRCGPTMRWSWGYVAFFLTGGEVFLELEVAIKVATGHLSGAQSKLRSDVKCKTHTGFLRHSTKRKACGLFYIDYVSK